MSSDEALARWQASIGNGAGQANSATVPPQAARPATAASALVDSALAWRKKTVLLIDSNLRSRESRAKVMRTKGVRVDCAANVDAARVCLAAEKYNLILVDPGGDTEIAESLVQEIRSKDSRQLVRFLVGSPLFVAKSLNGASSGRRKAAAMVAPATSPNETATSDTDFGQAIKAAEAGEQASGESA